MILVYDIVHEMFMPLPFPCGNSNYDPLQEAWTFGEIFSKFGLAFTLKWLVSWQVMPVP